MNTCSQFLLSLYMHVFFDFCVSTFALFSTFDGKLPLVLGLCRGCLQKLQSLIVVHQINDTCVTFATATQANQSGPNHCIPTPPSTVHAAVRNLSVVRKKNSLFRDFYEHPAGRNVLAIPQYGNVPMSCETRKFVWRKIKAGF